MQYRYLKTEGLWPDIELKNMVVDVLRRPPAGHARARNALIRHRTYDLDADGSIVLLNKMSPLSAFDDPVFCGQLMHIRQNAEYAGIVQSLEEDIAEVDLRSFSLEGQNRMVDGICYFAIWGNHVGIIEGNRTRARTLERYLTRLLQEATELEPGQVITLPAKLEGIKAGKVSEIDLAAPRVPSSNTPPSAIDGSADAGSEEGRDETVMKVLEAFGWRQEDIEALRASVPAEGWIEGLFSRALK